MRTLLAAVLALAPAFAAEVRRDGGIPQVHLDNLAALAALPAGGERLPLSSGRPLAGLSAPQLQAEYAKAAGLGALAPVPALPAPAPGLRPAAAGPAVAAAARTLEAPSSGEAPAAPAEQGSGDWALLAERFDGMKGPQAPDLGAVSGRGPPKQVAPGLLAASYTPQPSAQKLERWLGGAEPKGYSWAYLNIDRDLAREILDQIGAPPELRRAAERLHAGLDAAASAAVLDAEPEWAARFLKRRFDMEGAMFEAFPDLPALVTAWRARGASPATLRAVLDDAFVAGGEIRVVLSARSWAAMDARQREAAAAALHAGPIRLGSRLLLELGPGADLAALSRKYAAGRDPRALERLLRRAVARGEKTLPLEKILPPHIRRRLGKFADCTGPNCVNSVMSEADAYDDAVTLMARLNAAYDRVAPGEPVRAGDKLVYADLNKQFVHMAESVGDGWVFTKNGMGRHYPYLFQQQAAMEAVHFPSGEFRLIVFRPKLKK